MAQPQDEPGPRNLLAERRAKLERLRGAGIDPFPHTYPGRVEIAAVRTAHGGLRPGEETEASYRIAGRIAARRGHGKAAFLDLADGSGQIQLHSRADILGDQKHEQLVGLDLGDIVGASGTAFATRRGELSLRLSGWTLLAKSLRPPPEKFHGLADVETRYRRRELDLIANPEVREFFPSAAGSSPRSGGGSTTAGSSRSRRRCCSRSTVGRSPARSPRTTTRSSATTTCGSPPSST